MKRDAAVSVMCARVWGIGFRGLQRFRDWCSESRDCALIRAFIEGNRKNPEGFTEFRGAEAHGLKFKGLL